MSHTHDDTDGHSHTDEAHGHGHSHGDDHHHHDHASTKGFGGILNAIGAALHLPGFGHDHEHGYTELASDVALQDNNLGIQTVWLALLVLSITTILQIFIYVASGSVALLADTVHNLGDSLNSIPLLLALYLARKPATRRYQYGFGRAEDIAGVLIVISIAFSATYIIIASVQKFINPQPLTNLGWVALAAIIGFIGNELVALMQIRVGKKIGSDAMIADGQHARTDGLTSLAVLIAVFGTWVGLPILDPIIGIVIGFAIVGITWNATKTVWYRLMDATDPSIISHMQHHVEEIEGVIHVEYLRARWVGHRLYAEISVMVDENLSVAKGHDMAHLIRESMHHTIRQLSEVTIEMTPHHHHE